MTNYCIICFEQCKTKLCSCECYLHIECLDNWNKSNFNLNKNKCPHCKNEIYIKKKYSLDIWQLIKNLLIIFITLFTIITLFLLIPLLLGIFGTEILRLFLNSKIISKEDTKIYIYYIVGYSLIFISSLIIFISIKITLYKNSVNNIINP